MRKYKFNIKVVRMIPIEVIANSEVEARAMLDDLMKNSNFKNIKLEFNLLNNYKKKIIKDLFGNDY